MERLSGEFNRGYTKAIKDMQEVMEYTSVELTARHKQMNYKMVKRILEIALVNREKIRENMNGFIRWNTQLNDFEWYDKR